MFYKKVNLVTSLTKATPINGYHSDEACVAVITASRMNEGIDSLRTDLHNDNYRVRSWRSDAINYYITYCQIADLKLLTEN